MNPTMGEYIRLHIIMEKPYRKVDSPAVRSQERGSLTALLSEWRTCVAEFGALWTFFRLLHAITNILPWGMNEDQACRVKRGSRSKNLGNLSFHSDSEGEDDRSNVPYGHTSRSPN